MLCPRCGLKIPADSRFCERCGLRLDQEPFAHDKSGGKLVSTRGLGRRKFALLLMSSIVLLTAMVLVGIYFFRWGGTGNEKAVVIEYDSESGDVDPAIRPITEVFEAFLNVAEYSSVVSPEQLYPGRFEEFEESPNRIVSIEPAVYIRETKGLKYTVRIEGDMAYIENIEGRAYSILNPYYGDDPEFKDEEKDVDDSDYISVTGLLGTQVVEIARKDGDWYMYGPKKWLKEWLLLGALQEPMFSISLWKCA